MSRDPHELECARAAFAVLIEKAKTTAEKRRLQKELREWEQAEQYENDRAEALDSIGWFG